VTRRKGGKRQERDPDALTPREALFVLKLIELNNITEAYLRAGYRSSTREAASAGGARLVARGRVAAALEQARKQTLEKAGVDAAEAFRRIAQIADFEIGQLLKPGTNMVLPLSELPLEVRRCIKRVDNEGQVYLHDVMRALELIAESGGFIKRKVDVELEAGAGIVKMLEEIGRERAAQLGKGGK
jgi:phage terminase small subunit